MPGIYTHNKIFRETILSLSKRKKKNYLLRSVESIFTDWTRFKSGLFGSIGPNIFDYIPSRNKTNPYCHEISFALHNGFSEKFIRKMITDIYSSSDRNNEWTAIQRAYLYGFISHAVADAVIHPFIFYLSGFPNNFSKNEIAFFREQNLFISYNIDNYNLFSAGKKPEYNLNINDMIPLELKSKIKKIIPPVRNLILKTIQDTLPGQSIELKLLKRNKTTLENEKMTRLDLIPYLMPISYKIKHTGNEKLRNFIFKLRDRYHFYSDFIVRYPDPKKFNSHILNHHRERWQYPAGQIGARYESIDNLMNIAVEKTADIWIALEEGMYDKINEKNLSDLSLNLYTGEKGVDYFKMHHKNPVKLKLF